MGPSSSCPDVHLGQKAAFPLLHGLALVGLNLATFNWYNWDLGTDGKDVGGFWKQLMAPKCCRRRVGRTQDCMCVKTLLQRENPVCSY